MSVIVRFAPSPTGPLHLGSARTALFNYLFAKQQGGKIYLRIEDTDRERSKPEFEQNIIEDLEWLGLKFDNPQPIRQSERAAIYRAALEKLIASGTAYVSKETAEAGEVSKRGEVIRFKNPGQPITFQDVIRGGITFDTRELGDFVIAKSLTEPLYHLAAVVDDWKMNITHVIRGEDHIANTPRQILIQEALSAPRPSYAHIPLILAPNRSKLSKRHLPDGQAGGAVAVAEYRARGYLSKALVNYLVLLGWNPGTEEEIFSLEELIQQFSLAKVQKSGAVFNLAKLNWLNREYIKRLPDEMLFERLPTAVDQATARKIMPLVKERLVTLTDWPQLMSENGEFSYFFNRPVYDKGLLKNQAHFAPLRVLIESVPDDQFNAVKIKKIIMPYADVKGRGEVLWPFRAALTGREKSADPFTVAALLGKIETLARLDYAANLV